MMSSKKMMVWRIALLAGLVLAGVNAWAQTARSAALTAVVSTNAPKLDQAFAKPGLANSPVTNGFSPISFETLAAFPIKVDWLVNPTNSSLDTLRRAGKIPDDIKSLHGKKVALQGFMKPLKQDGSGVTEFLLMRDHALCCQEKVPQINEWIHVQTAGKGVAYAHERLVTVQGDLEVGELLGRGNVVSIYRIKGAEVIASAGSSLR